MYTSKIRRTTALYVKLNTWACRASLKANIWSRLPHVWEKKKWCIFCRKGRFHVSFLKFYSAMYVTSSQHNNVQVTITVTCLSFAVTGSRILLPAVSSCRRVETVAKIALNSNGESKLQGTSSEALDYKAGSNFTTIRWKFSFTNNHARASRFCLLRGVDHTERTSNSTLKRRCCTNHKPVRDVLVQYTSPLE